MSENNDTLNIENMDQFAMLITSWHVRSLEQLNRAMETPADVAIAFTDEEGTEIELTEDQRKGFLVGLTVAKAVFNDLPFTMTPIDQEQPAEVTKDAE